jgi:imidazoleglycerol-phosphate dehydratase
MATARTASVSRKTSETEIEVFLDLDCAPGSAKAQTINVSTGIGFLDHVRLVFSIHPA